MTIQTRSMFYYDYVVTETNYGIDFNEGASEVQASLNIGEYTPTDLANEVARAMNLVGDDNYNVAFNRTDRTFTITSDSTFDLLFGTGTRSGISANDLLGFNLADTGVAASHTSDNATGKVYRPQFKLQKYVDPEYNKRANQASINESASGVIEVLKFGNVSFYEFEFKYITDIAQSTCPNSPLENNPTGVLDAIEFMDYCITKGDLEFIPDRDDPSTFTKVLLESTSSDKKGTGYKLRELYGRGLTGYYDSGVLKFRLLD